MRHIEGGESEEDDDEEYDNFDMDHRFGRLNLCDSGISSLQQRYESFLASSHDECNNDEDVIEFHLENDTDIELDSDIDIAEEQANINRIMGYKNYPEILIDDPDAGFPLLHEIGETIDELQLIMHAHIMKYSLSL